MTALLIAFGVSFVPLGLFVVLVLSNVEPGCRCDALRTPSALWAGPGARRRKR